VDGLQVEFSGRTGASRILAVPLAHAIPLPTHGVPKERPLVRVLRPPRPFDDAQMERAFRRRFLVSGLRFSRLALLSGACLAAAFWLSLIGFPEARLASPRQLIRLAVVLALGASALFLYFQPRRALRHYVLAVGAPAALACAAIAVLGLLPPDFEYQRNARLAVAMTVACWLMYGFTRLPGPHVALICGAASVLTAAGASLHQDEYHVALVVYLLVANLVGWTMLVGNERRERALFLSSVRQTQLKQALEASARESAEANAAKSRVLAAVNHDLRQPLTSMALYLALLEPGADGRLSPEAATSLERIRECVAAMTGRVARLAEAAQSSDCLRGTRTSCVDLHPLFHRLESVFQAEAERQGVRLYIRLPAPGVFLAPSDEERLWDILSNLVGNALKYADRSRRPWVLVRAARFGDRLRITVRDNGIGIDPAFHKHIFDEYFRVDDGSRQPEGSCGLGLSIVRESVSRLPGHRVALTSEPGQGTRFDVLLPVQAPRLPATTIGPRQREDSAVDDRSFPVALESVPAGAVLDCLAASDPLPGCYALVVDEHGPTRAALTETLERWGMIVEAAGSATEAIEVVRRAERLFDVVVSDANLPGAPCGDSLIQAVCREQGGETPAILVSARPAQTAPGRLKGGRLAGKIKPVDPAELRARLVACVSV
jgi:signal transduction histidine kinase